MEEEREEHMLQMQMQQQFMTTMLMMMSGRAGIPTLPPRGMNANSNAQNNEARGDYNQGGGKDHE